MSSDLSLSGSEYEVDTDDCDDSDDELVVLNVKKKKQIKMEHSNPGGQDTTETPKMEKTNSKPKYYKQKFLSAWLINPQFEQWLTRKLHNGDVLPYCNVCQVKITCSKSSISRHGKSVSHQKAFKRSEELGKTNSTVNSLLLTDFIEELEEKPKKKSKKRKPVAPNTSTPLCSAVPLSTTMPICSSVPLSSSEPLSTSMTLTTLEKLEPRTILSENQKLPLVIAGIDSKSEFYTESTCFNQSSTVEVQSLNFTLEGGTTVTTDMVMSVEEEPAGESSKVGKEQEASGKRKYVQKFRSVWKDLPEFQGWLAEGHCASRAYCTVCDKEMIATKSDLQKHASGDRHKKKLAERSSYSLTASGFCDLDETGVSVAIRFVDLRSDTVTKPPKQMKEAMYHASVGDDVFSEDPTVTALERKVAELLEKEAALFVPSGTMANLICVMAHCWVRGSEIVVGDESHLHQWSQGGMAQVGNVHHRSLKNLPDGTFSLAELRNLVRGEDPRWPTMTLVCIENTHNMKGGKALPLEWLDELGKVCKELNLSIHMDGARLMNASVALGLPPSRLVASCDTVAFCLNKGLGAPMGSVVVGSQDFINRAVRMRKVLGGSLHQSGMMAAAGIFALDHIPPRLSWDHSHARAIAQSISDTHSGAVTVDLRAVQTNIVLLQCDNVRVNAKKLCERLQTVPEAEAEDLGEKIIVMALPISESCVRIMTHYDVRKEDVKAVINKIQYVIKEFDNLLCIEYKMNV